MKNYELLTIFKPNLDAEEVDKAIEKISATVVEFGGNKEGMIHISKLSNKRVEKVEDVVKIGEEVEVEVIKIDEKGRVDLKRILPKVEKEENNQ